MSYGQANYRGNTIYDQLGNKNQNNYKANQNTAYNQGNQVSGLTRKNQADFNNNKNNNNANNSNKNLANLKYPDLEIQTHFNDGSNNDANSQSNNELDALMREYQTVFQDVDNMINQFSGGTDNTYKLNNIKKDLKDLDAYCASEHERFLSELFDISKDNNIYDYDYKKYKQNCKTYDDKIKKVISDNKYEVILSTNKHNSQENKERINNYIKKKKDQSNTNKKKYENPNSYDPPSNNYSNYNNYGNQNKSSSSSGQQFNFGNSIYGNNQNNNQDNGQRYPPYAFGNNIYSNQNNSNKQYENPNEIGNGDIYGNDNNYRGRSIYGNNYNPNQYESQNYGGKISVRFTYQNNNTTVEYSSSDKADLIYYKAYEIKDGEPKIYNRKGRSFTYETLKDLRVIDVFEGAEYSLSIY